MNVLHQFRDLAKLLFHVIGSSADHVKLDQLINLISNVLENNDKLNRECVELNRKLSEYEVRDYMRREFISAPASPHEAPTLRIHEDYDVIPNVVVMKEAAEDKIVRVIGAHTEAQIMAHIRSELEASAEPKEVKETDTEEAEEAEEVVESEEAEEAEETEEAEEAEEEEAEELVDAEEAEETEEVVEEEETVEEEDVVEEEEAEEAEEVEEEEEVVEEEEVEEAEEVVEEEEAEETEEAEEAEEVEEEEEAEEVVEEEEAEEVVEEEEVEETEEAEEVVEEEEVEETEEAEDEEMEIIKIKKKQFFCGAKTRKVYAYIDDETAGDCIGIYVDGKITSL
jgi:S-DNA-T family DNA segregation ATPase FtsK/SpoIIIE